MHLKESLVQTKKMIVFQKGKNVGWYTSRGKWNLPWEAPKGKIILTTIL